MLGEGFAFGLEPEGFGQLLESLASADGRMLSRIDLVQVEVLVLEDALPH